MYINIEYFYFRWSYERKVNIIKWIDPQSNSLFKIFISYNLAPHVFQTSLSSSSGGNYYYYFPKHNYEVWNTCRAKL